MRSKLFWAFLVGYLFIAKTYPDAPLSKEIYALADKCEQALANKTLFIVYIHQILRYSNERKSELCLPNLTKLILDKSGKIYWEEAPIVPAKTGIGKGEKVADSQIEVFDGKFLWIYDPLLKVYTKKKPTPEELEVKREFNKEWFICTQHLLKASLPYLKCSTLKKEKYEGKDAFLLILNFPGGQERRYWVDVKTCLPLQGEVLTPHGKGKSIDRYKVIEMKLNPKLLPGVFVFKPPKGAKGVDYQTYRKLQKQWKQAAEFHNKMILERKK